MDHFFAGDWSDFARGLSTSQTALMQSHLDQACVECRKTAEAWGLIRATLAEEASYLPPEDVVRAIKSTYVPPEPERWLPKVAQFARLVFDSFTQPQLAMVRAAMPSSRLLLHEAEPFTIDLRLESDPVRNRISLMGQVLNSRDSEQATGGIDVILLSGERLLKKTAANSAGEFDLDFGAAGNLQLFINIHGQRAIGIVLPDMDS